MAHPLVTGTVETQKLTRELGLTDHERDFLKVKDNRRLYDGDHWLDGRGYIGAPPDPLDPNAGELWARLRRSFTSYNAVREISDRLAGCILGQVPDYGLTVRRSRRQIPKQVPDPNFVPPADNPTAAAPMIPDPTGATVPEPLTPDEQNRIAEAAAALEVFYSKRKPLKYLKKLFLRRLLQGRAYLRLTVPPKFRNSQTGRVAEARDLNEAVERIFFTEPDIEDAVCLTEEETRDELALTRYKRPGNKEVFELVFTDDAGRTVIATVEKVQNFEPAGSQVRGVAGLLPAAPYAVTSQIEERLLANVPDENISDPMDLNGRLTVFEQAGEPLITEQVRTQNFSVNLNLTMSNHVTVESGFRELAVTNVEVETVKVPDAAAPGGFREVPKRAKRGAGVIHNFMSVSLGTDPVSGVEEVADTEIKAFEPVALTSFDTGQNMFRRNILSEVHQLWALITGDAAPSGESRIQALADFVILALDYQEECDDAGTWLFETVLYWAAILAGKPGRFNDLRANFKTRLYLGKLSPGELQQLMTEVEKRLLSKESYMMLAGRTSDPAEERERIEREDARSVEGQRARINLEADKRALGVTGGGDSE